MMTPNRIEQINKSHQVNQSDQLDPNRSLKFPNLLSWQPSLAWKKKDNRRQKYSTNKMHLVNSGCPVLAALAATTEGEAVRRS